LTGAIPAPEAFTIFMPAAGWAAEMLTTAEDLEYMAEAYQSQRSRRPGVAMCPATWGNVAGLFSARPGGWSVSSALRVVVHETHDPGTITFFDEVEDATAPCLDAATSADRERRIAMDAHPDDRETTRYQALKDRYPTSPAAQNRLDQEELRVLRQAVRDLSEVVRGLAAYLIDVSAQADAGETGEEPQNREQVRVLAEEAAAIRERFPAVRP
jgi:hypothetical protein